MNKKHHIGLALLVVCVGLYSTSSLAMSCQKYFSKKKVFSWERLGVIDLPEVVRAGIVDYSPKRRTKTTDRATGKVKREAISKDVSMANLVSSPEGKFLVTTSNYYNVSTRLGQNFNIFNAKTGKFLLTSAPAKNFRKTVLEGLRIKSHRNL